VTRDVAPLVRAGDGLPAALREGTAELAAQAGIEEVLGLVRVGVDTRQIGEHLAEGERAWILVSGR